MKKLSIAGWVAAGSLGALLFAGGFNQDSQKFAVVDTNKIIELSDLYKDSKAKLEAMNKSRTDVIVFLATYRVASAEQVLRLKDLSVKTNATQPEKDELNKIKNDIMAADKKWRELQQKPNPAPDDTTLLRDYQDRANRTDATVDRLRDDFSQELQNYQRQQMVALQDSARAAIQSAAKAAGYTLVFDQTMVPYGANDLTDAALKAMNAKK
jgi:Skp family chaperone for outer membrane proteins